MGENIQDLQKVSNALKITGLTAQLLQLTLFELFLHNVQSWLPLFHLYNYV